MPYREKRILSGDYLEVEIYFISDKERKASRKDKRKESSYKQKNLNEKNSRKWFKRLFYSNFTDKDISIHLTYAPEYLPKSYEEARKNEENYIRRLNSYRKRIGLPKIKYLSVIEYHTPDGMDKRKRIRIHHHIIMSGMDRDAAEKLWRKGRANADRLKADANGYEGIANYLMKDPQGAKRWRQSKNLKKPDIHINDFKYSKKKTEQLAMFIDDRALFEKEYPGFTYIECKSSVNDITASRQIYIKMRKRPEEQKEGGTYVKRAKFD